MRSEPRIDGATFLRMLHEWAARTEGVKAVYAGMECRGSVPVLVLGVSPRYDFALSDEVCRMMCWFADEYGVGVNAMLQPDCSPEERMTDGIAMPQVFPRNDFLRIVEEQGEALRKMASGGCLSHEEAWRVLMGDKRGTV